MTETIDLIESMADDGIDVSMSGELFAWKRWGDVYLGSAVTGVLDGDDAYMPPYGLPLRWMDEITDLPACVKAYVNHCAGEGAAPDKRQLRRVIAYLRYFIYAPVWMDPDMGALREQAMKMRTSKQVREWIRECLKVGIDPL